MIALGLCAALLPLGSQDIDTSPTPRPAPTPKVLMVFIDGFLPEAIELAETPALDRLLRRAAWSLRARAES